MDIGVVSKRKMLKRLIRMRPGLRVLVSRGSANVVSEMGCKRETSTRVTDHLLSRVMERDHPDIMQAENLNVVRPIRKDG